MAHQRDKRALVRFKRCAAEGGRHIMRLAVARHHAWKALGVRLHPFGLVARPGVLPRPEPQQVEADIVGARLRKQCVDPGEVVAAFLWFDLFPRDGDLQRIGVKRVDGRPDLRQHCRIIGAVVGLAAKDQKRRAVDVEDMPAVAADDTRQRAALRRRAGGGEQQAKR